MVNKALHVHKQTGRRFAASRRTHPRVLAYGLPWEPFFNREPYHPTMSIQIKNLRFRWQRQGPDILDIPKLEIVQGERVFLYGPSGSGKTTLLNLLSGVTVPSSGDVTVLDTPLHHLSGRQRDRFRAQNIGIIFQQFNLIPYLTVLANVQLASQLAGHTQAKAEPLLSALGLAEDLWQRPAYRLSVGQQQRVAVARALINQPRFIIADEPTSALDTDLRDDFLNILMRLAQEHTATILFVSHDRTLEHHFDRQLDIRSLQQESQS